MRLIADNECRSNNILARVDKASSAEAVGFHPYASVFAFRWTEPSTGLTSCTTSAIQ